MAFLRKYKYPLLLAVIAANFFLTRLGGVHLFDWDEINFAEIAREMIVLGDYLRVHIDFLPFWEKPPFFFWLQATAMQLFGISEFAARLPNAVCGVLTLMVLYAAGKQLFDEKFGIWWATAYLGSLLPNFYFRSGLIDPWLNLFIFTGIYGFLLYYFKSKSFTGIRLRLPAYGYLLLGGCFIGLGVLTKGPVALVLFGLTFLVYWALQRFRLFVRIPSLLLFGAMALLVPITWFAIEWIKNGPWFVTEFIQYQFRLLTTPDAGHGGFPGYHVVVLLFGCFPASVIAIRSLFGQRAEKDHQQVFKTWMVILFWMVLILFSLVNTKIVHYSSMAYFPITFLAAYTIHRITQQRLSWSKGLSWLLAITGGLIVLVLIAFPFVAKNKAVLLPLINDPFARANLQADVYWSGREALIGGFALIILITSLVLLIRKRWQYGFFTLFFGMALTLHAAVMVFVPRIEGYSQRAAIEFFERLQNKDCYVQTLGYKSYAHLFYTRKQPQSHPKSHDTNWLLRGDIDKDAYFVTKVHKAKEYNHIPGLREIGRKNGFVFLKRKVAD